MMKPNQTVFLLYLVMFCLDWALTGSLLSATLVIMKFTLSLMTVALVMKGFAYVYHEGEKSKHVERPRYFD